MFSEVVVCPQEWGVRPGGFCAEGVPFGWGSFEGGVMKGGVHERGAVKGSFVQLGCREGGGSVKGGCCNGAS